MGTGAKDATTPRGAGKVSRVCTVCLHRRHTEINRALLAGESYRTIADRFGLSKTALIRHKAAHLPRWLTQAQEAEDMAEADDLLDQMSALHRRTLAILGQAEVSGETKIALSASREARNNLELLAKLTGELKAHAQVNIVMLPGYVAMRSAIMAALQRHPQARQDVASALLALDEGHDADAYPG
jgi:hypothetical protein